MSENIEGVITKDLIVHKDQRGSFSELIRSSEDFFGNSFAQLSYSTVYAGVTKAWHLHRKQTDWMCTLVGDMKLVLYDTRQDSPTHKKTMEVLMGKEQGGKVVKVPPGVAHGYKVINGPMYILYITDREYDPEDDLRIPHDDPEIGYDWISCPAIK